MLDEKMAQEMREAAPFDRPHEGAISNVTAPDLVGRLRELNEMLSHSYRTGEEIERGIVGGRGRDVPKNAASDPRVQPAAEGSDGVRWQIDLALTRATGLVGLQESIVRHFRDPTSQPVSTAQDGRR